MRIPALSAAVVFAAAGPVAPGAPVATGAAGAALAPSPPAACAAPAGFADHAAGLAPEVAAIAALVRGAACRQGRAGAIVIRLDGESFAVLRPLPPGGTGPVTGAGLRSVRDLAAFVLWGFPRGPAP